MTLIRTCMPYYKPNVNALYIFCCLVQDILSAIRLLNNVCTFEARLLSSYMHTHKSYCKYINLISALIKLKRLRIITYIKKIVMDSTQMDIFFHYMYDEHIEFTYFLMNIWHMLYPEKKYQKTVNLLWIEIHLP